MPAKNVVKIYQPYHYYHVYNRGVAKQAIFMDQADKRYFLHLFDRYFNPANSDTNNAGQPYPKFHTTLELLCYCLMKNHFHLLFYLHDKPDALTLAMKSLCTSYTMYFNLKYGRVGPLFQGTFKASIINRDDYLLHISRYIHLNPREYKTYKYSSLPAYLGKITAPWLHPEKILELFEDTAYLDFLEDYEEHKAIMDKIKLELAN